MRETDRVVAGWRQRWETGTRYYEARLHPARSLGRVDTDGRLGDAGHPARSGAGPRPCASYAEGVTLLAAVGRRRI